MSTQITTAFVQEYEEGITLLAQQEGSRLRNKGIRIETSVIGKSCYIDQVGVRGRPGKIITRHGDTPQNDTPHARRKIDLIDYDDAELIDKLDRVKTLNQPDNMYVQALAASFGREIDHILLDAATGDALTGEAGGTTISFPASQQVAVNSHAYGAGSGNAGLTISKLIEARNILEKNETLNKGANMYLAVNADAISDLLQTVEVTSAEYNQVRALESGEIDRFMGFEFVRTELLNQDGSGYDQVLAYTDNALGLAIGADVMGRISERDDKRYAWQAYFCMSMGATRLEEERIVEIKCA